MRDLNQASVGVYGNYWEYRRGIHRRLFCFDSFYRDDVLSLGKVLEGVDNTNYYQEIKFKDVKAKVYIDSSGVVMDLSF